MRPDLNRSLRSFFDPRGDDLVARRLRELPGEPDTPYDWTEFRRRERARNWRPRHAVKWQHAATAAGVTVFIAVMAIWGRAAHHEADASASTAGVAPQSQERGVVANGAHANHDVAPKIGAATLALTQQAAIVAAQRANSERAQASQQWLARQPAEPAVVRVGPRLAVANLEDRIAWLDDALTDEQLDDVHSTHVTTLQQERARLVNSLAQVRYAETLAAVN
jgi:hypothetical protein